MAPLCFSLLADADPGLFEQVRSFFQEGGFFMILLGLTSVAGLAAIVFKFLSLQRGRIVPGELAAKVDGFENTVQGSGVEPVLREFDRGESALARLCAVAVRHRGKSQSEIADAIQAMAREEIVRLQAGMAAIDVVIAVAPLLGLLGTAAGLVVVFDGLQGDSDWVRIGFGIGRALKTTIVGLAIAVPAIIAQGYFQRKIDTYASRLEVLLTKLAHVCERTPRPEGAPALPARD